MNNSYGIKENQASKCKKQHFSDTDVISTYVEAALAASNFVYPHESVQATSKINKNTRAKKEILLLFYFYLYQTEDYNHQNLASQTITKVILLEAFICGNTNST
jgi:hypothetical protein